MLDTYYWGDVSRISPEAPVPVFRKWKEKSVPGGAANVACNLLAANQNVSLITAVGKDKAAEQLLQMLTEAGMDVSLSIRLDRPTSVKTRFMAGDNHQVIRMDVEETGDISSEECENLLSVSGQKIKEADILILSDYAKGLLSESVCRRVIALANQHHKKVLVDVKGTAAEKYAGAYLLKPNVKELHDLTGCPVASEEEITAAAKLLCGRCKGASVLVTRGAKGMMLVDADRNAPDGDGVHKIAADNREVYDVTGAGDTAMAYLAACIANQFSLVEAVETANHAAGIQVSKMGTSAVGLLEVAEAVSAEQTVSGKILKIGMAGYLRSVYAQKKIVFTNGCFDILHVGHIRYLRQAAELGDILVVGLNSDHSVQKLKGKGRPVNPERERAELLCSLEFVDYVIIFEEDTPYELIAALQPDVLVKGGDYLPQDIVGGELVQKRGGVVKALSLVEGKSTTKIIEQIWEQQ